MDVVPDEHSQPTAQERDVDKSMARQLEGHSEATTAMPRGLPVDDDCAVPVLAEGWRSLSALS